MSWQYRVDGGLPFHLQTAMEEILNALDAEGWELVAIVPPTHGAAMYGMIFRRLIQDASPAHPGQDHPRT